jgi:hypothetical protein
MKPATSCGRRSTPKKLFSVIKLIGIVYMRPAWRLITRCR